MNARLTYLVDEGDGKGARVSVDLFPSNDLGLGGVPDGAVLGLCDRVGSRGGNEGKQSGGGETEHCRVKLKRSRVRKEV